MASDNGAADRMKGALWGVIIGDALGVPVHWYYNPDILKKDYGEVTGYVDCKHPHSEAFMNLIKYDGKADILHDKAKSYNQKVDPSQMADGEQIHGNTVVKEPRHFHDGLKAGDNTVDVYLFRALLRFITKNKEYREDAWLEEFQTFFKTPGNHPDTYLSQYIRNFFENLDKDGMVPHNAGMRQYDNWSVCNAVGMVHGFAVALLNNKRPAQATARAIHHINLTNRSENLTLSSLILCPMLLKLIDGADVESTLKEFASQVNMSTTSGVAIRNLYRKHKGPDNIPKEDVWYLHTTLQEEAFDPSKFTELDDREFLTNVSSTVCYSEYAVPTAFYLSLKYLKDFEKALLASTNCGGDTCGRNAVLGAVMGACVGESGIPEHLLKGLKNYDAIKEEIDAFVSLSLGV